MPFLLLLIGIVSPRMHTLDTMPSSHLAMPGACGGAMGEVTRGLNPGPHLSGAREGLLPLLAPRGYFPLLLTTSWSWGNISQQEIIS